MYHHEFSLISSKWIFRLEDMTELEQKLWIEHLSRDGFEITDPHEIFEPFQGESAIHLNEDVGTQELRIRVWNWTDSNNKVHELLDMNHWPGDNESGIIAFDGEIKLDNGDQDISFCVEEELFNFDDRLNFFSEIRKKFIDDRECFDDDIREDYEAFFLNQHSITIESTAWNLYQSKMDKIRSDHDELRVRYGNDFEIIGQTNSGITIGYELKLDMHRKTDKNATFTFTKWIDRNIYLVIIVDNWHWETYVLNKEGKIDYMIYKSTYLSDNFDPKHEIMMGLAPRIHSYLDMIRNYSPKTSPLYSGIHQ